MTTTLFGGKSPEALPWNPLPYMEEYIQNLEVDEKAPTYLRSVKLGLTRLAIFLRDEEGVRHPDEITRAHILRYQAYLLTLEHNGEKLSTSYRQQMLKYARGWINWLSEVEHIDGNPWVRIRVGRVTKKPKPLEDDELASLFAAHRQQAFTIAPFFYHRRETILVVLLAWGLRIHELQALTLAQMDMRLDWVTLRQKGGSEKTLPWDVEMKQVVGRYLTHRAKYAQAGEDGLLIDQNGKRLSTDMVYKIVKECGARAGIDINPHRLRDTCGTKLLDNDVPVERIMKILGHTQRSQTLAYSRVNDPKVAESHTAVMNPLIHELLGGELP